MKGSLEMEYHKGGGGVKGEFFSFCAFFLNWEILKACLCADGSDPLVRKINDDAGKGLIVELSP